MKKKILLAVFTSALSLTAFAGVFATSQKEERYVPTFATYTNHDADTYYNGISDSLTGTQLLSALQSLNKNRRKSTVGYGSMGTSPSGQFKYTDYDPATVRYDSNNQPYGTRLISFYSGNSATSGMNREHVWPDSHGGNTVEADIHMPRPTIEAENGSRGNSFYVTGMKSNSKGWDPAMESFGLESYRGDSARIIFYCVVANSNLSLSELTYHQTSKNNRDMLMGKLSHMITWHLQNPVQQREMNRNEGAEYLQGNRNPFIDHPEYVCRIWGNSSSEARTACDTYEKYVRIYRNGISVSDQTLYVGDVNSYDAYFNYQQVSNVTWSLETEAGTAYVSDEVTITPNGGSVTVTASKTGSAYLAVSYNDGSKDYKSRIKLTVVPAVEVSKIEVKNPKTEYTVGETFVKPSVIATYTDGHTNDVKETASFSGFDSSAPVANQVINVTYQSKSTSFTVNINAAPIPAPASKGGCGGDIATTSIILASISFVGVSLLLVNKVVRKKKKR